MAIVDFLKRPVTIHKSTVVLSVLLLIVSQLLVTQWTVEVAGNRDVIDFISFAGTVVGIILAFLAIIYSYFTAVSQKDDAESVRSQISNLNDAVSRANNAGTQFSVELSRLENIRQELADVSAISNRHLKLTESMSQEVSLLAEKQKQAQARTRRAKKSQAAEVEGDPTSSELAELKLIQTATVDQTLMYFLALAEHTVDIAEDESAMVDFEPFRSEFLEKGLKNADRQDFWSAFLWGESLGYYFVFGDIGATSDGRFRAAKEALLVRLREINASASFVFHEDAASEKISQAKVWLSRDLHKKEAENISV